MRLSGPYNGGTIYGHIEVPGKIIESISFSCNQPRPLAMRLEFFQAAAIAEARLVDNETTLGPARLANGPGKNQETTLFQEMLGPVYTIIVLRFFHMSCDLFPATIL